MSQPKPSTDDLVTEFVQLNRRRVFGTPPLAVRELERWQTVREKLAQRVGDRLPSLVAGVERRAHFRFATHLEVRFETGDELRSACLGNISEGGIFIAIGHPLPAGTPLRLSIAAGDDTIDMPGRVAWAREASSPNGPAGMGIRFEELSPQQRDRIADWVRRHAPEVGRA